MQPSRRGEGIIHSRSVAAAMADTADAGGYEYLPFHNTIEVKGRNRGKLCALFYFSCIIYFFYHRFLGTDWKAANALEFVAVFCELFFAYLWVQNQIMTWFFTVRYTDPERLCRSYGYENLPPVDIFITTVDPWKEPPLILVNTILSVLSVDYPFEKISCYVSDDGGSPLNFYALLKAYEFAEKWVPFCKRFNIEPRAPMVYFSRPVQNESESVRFSGEWEELKQEYEKVKIDISRAMECGQVPTEVQEMFDELSGNDQTIETGNHPGLIKSFDQWVDLPPLIYVSREKRPGWKHHYKAGALNSLARVSGVMTNSPFILNLDCDMYVNNSKALLHAMCFHLDPHIQEEDCLSFVQFPQHFSGIDEHDIYGTKMTFTFDVLIRGLDGLQGPIYFGTGCVHRRKALFGSKPRSHVNHSNGRTGFQKSKISYETLTEMFGESPTFLASVVNAIGSASCCSTESLNSYSTQDILHLISTNYELNTKWGEEVGWMYGSRTEDILTGYKMHRKGWKSVYCCPYNPAFIGTAPSKLVDVLEQRKRWSKGMLEVFLSKNCPLFGGYANLNFLQRLVYIHICSHALYSIPLMVYGLLPTVSLYLRKPFIPKVLTVEFIPFILIFGCNYILSLVQSKWLGIYRRQWWNNMRMWMIVILTSDVVATFEVLLNLLGLLNLEHTFSISPKSVEVDDDASETTAGPGDFIFDDSLIFIIPTVYTLFNIWALLDRRLIHGNIMTGELFCVTWILFNLFPFVRGLFKEELREGALGLTTTLYSCRIVATWFFLLVLYNHNVFSTVFYVYGVPIHLELLVHVLFFLFFTVFSRVFYGR